MHRIKKSLNCFHKLNSQRTHFSLSLGLEPIVNTSLLLTVQLIRYYSGQKAPYSHVRVVPTAVPMQTPALCPQTFDPACGTRISFQNFAALMMIVQDGEEANSESDSSATTGMLNLAESLWGLRWRRQPPTEACGILDGGMKGSSQLNDWRAVLFRRYRLIALPRLKPRDT